jgi:hypothetical protein
MSMMASVVKNQVVFNASKGFLVDIVWKFSFGFFLHSFGCLCLPPTFYRIERDRERGGIDSYRPRIINPNRNDKWLFLIKYSPKRKNLKVQL